MSDVPAPSLDGAPFSEAFDQALAASPLTMTGLQSALVARGHRVSVATLSYWKSGRSLPTRSGSMEILTSIEDLLGLAPSTLASALHSTLTPSLRLLSLLPDAERPQAVMDSLGLTFQSPYAFEALHDVLRVGGKDGLDRVTTHMLLRADGPGVDRVPLVLSGPTVGLVPQVTVLRGARLGRTVALDGTAVVVCELLLPRELATGERHWLDYEVDWPADRSGVCSHARQLTRPCTFLTLGVEFEGQVPDEVRFTHDPPNGEAAVEVTRWSPAPRELQHTLRNAPPGNSTLSWETAEDEEAQG